jgi:ankyrin repeat protein
MENNGTPASFSSMLVLIPTIGKYMMVSLARKPSINDIRRPISAHDNNPRNKAFDFILQGFLSKEEVETLGCLTAGSDWIEDQNFTVLHKIVTGLNFQSLDDALVLYQDDIDAVDALGRTPLTWAAARGDEKAVATLLSYGAGLNTLDIQWTGPVSYAAERSHVVCVRLLLEAGACPDPIIPGGLQIGSPLNCAARNSTNALVLKTLLDFGADVDASGVDGKTPLIHVSRTDNASFATLLLEYGADINAADITSHTPLTTAITYNSHNVLQLLLDRWFEYSSCPRLRGHHLLETAAVFADLETLKILVATDHFRLKYDKDYILADCAIRVQDRYDVDDQILAAFKDLVSVISDIPEMAESGLSRLEAGLLMYKDSPLVKNGMSGRWSDSDSEVSFEDAMESLLI